MMQNLTFKTEICGTNFAEKLIYKERVTESYFDLQSESK